VSFPTFRRLRPNPQTPDGAPLLRRNEVKLWCEAAVRQGIGCADDVIFALRQRSGAAYSEQTLERLVYATKEDGKPWPLRCAWHGCENEHPSAPEGASSDTEGWLCPEHNHG